MTATQPSTTCRPRAILAAVGRVYGDAWRAIDSLRASRREDFPDWPDWCFLPLQAVYAIVSGGEGRRVPVERIHHVAILGVLASWRVTQGIYRFDPAVAEAVAGTPLSGELPAQLLYRLPE